MKQQYNFLMTPSTHGDLKKMAAELGLNMGECVRFLLDYYTEAGVEAPCFNIDKLLYLNR